MIFINFVMNKIVRSFAIICNPFAAIKIRILINMKNYNTICLQHDCHYELHN